uniref:BTB/POZ domain-containing protein 18 isoform X1 n=1 Tax=Pogona vitticeps TaxID=103695 RepID=A0ABM5F806_9SAUR
MKPPCAKVISNDNSTEQKEIKKQKSSVASLSGDKQQISKGPTVTAEPLKTKAKKRPSGMVRSILDNSESGALHEEETGTVQRQPIVSLKESKMIKLHRSKVSSAPSPVPSATKDHSTMMSSKLSRPNRRLWRQKSRPGKEEAKDAEDSIHLPGLLSRPLLPKPNKSRKRNFSEPAPSSDIPSGAGQIGRVKLRKVIDGSCWEVVQESPGTQPARAANTVCPLKGEVSQPQPRYPVSVADGQQSANSARLLPAKQETVCCSEENLVKQDESKVAFVEGDSTAGIPYDLNMFMTEYVAEDEQYDSLASAGELEHMLDLLLVDAAAGESQVTAVPEGTHMACPAQGGNKSPLKSTGAEEKGGSLTEVSVSALLVEIEESLQREQETTDLETLKEIDGSSSGCPLLDPVLRSPSLATNESISDSPDLCRPVSLNDGTVPKPLLSVLENGAARFTEPLPVTVRCDEDQEALSYKTELLGTETKPHIQAVDCKLSCIFASLEEDELDVGGRDVFKCSDPYFHEVVPNSSFPHTPTPSVYGEHSEEQMAQRTE